MSDIKEPIHIISLGAGVQSSTMALMAAAGEITPMPHCAIFADTQAEPASVYKWLDWLEQNLPFPIHRVTAGNIEEDMLRMLGGRAERSRCGQPPFFVQQPGSNDTGGRLWRQCTKEYKLEPLRREGRRVMKLAGARSIVQWIGISLDELHRAKVSGVRYVTNRFPLIDGEITRRACLSWMAGRGFSAPPKSACRWCPYMSDRRWREMRSEEPDDFAKAVAFDAALRAHPADRLNGVKITGRLFLHRSMRPLAEVDLSTDVDRGQMEMFGCTEGMCGV